MKILTLTAENVKKLRVVEIKPSGALVQVTGKNGSGKSSVLDSIYWALAGKEVIQGKPVRNGAEKARIKLDMGELIVERRFTAAGGTSLSVSNAEGAHYGSPQAMLDKLLGELTFDPLAFSRMPQKLQVTELQRASKLSINLEELERLDKGDYARRTDINRDAKAARARVPADYASLPSEPVNEAEILNRLQAAAEHNNSIGTAEIIRQDMERGISAKRGLAERHRDSAAHRRSMTESRIAELEREIQRVREDGEKAAVLIDGQANAAILEAEGIEARLASLPDTPAPIDIADFRRQLSEAKEYNAKVTKRQSGESIAAEAERLEKESQAITDRMEARAALRGEAIAASDMPVPGLGFGDGVVTYNGIPFDQASSAEQLRVSVAIAMAANPKLRVIRIKDGSLLDEDGIRLISEMAEANDYQVWIEKVESSGKVGIVMEDGAVSAVNQPELFEEPVNA
jgi:ABC-type cobalamin/Fe3+-siderophores transport system ATPase subunit